MQATKSATPTRELQADPGAELVVRMHRSPSSALPPRRRHRAAARSASTRSRRGRGGRGATARRSSIARSTCVLSAEVEPPERGAERERRAARRRRARGRAGASTAPAPITTTDSPSATMMTRPCRSTKCEAETTNPSVLVNHGVTQIRTRGAGPEHATARRLPATPPTSDEPGRRRGCTGRSAGSPRPPRPTFPSRTSRACRSDDDEVGETEGETVALVRVRDRERADEEAAHAADAAAIRKRRRSVAIAFVSQA